MIYRDFKGQKLSQLGFGCMRFASDPETGEIDQAKVNAMFDLAIREGVNYFDTAYPYLGGKSEIAMAEGLVTLSKGKLLPRGQVSGTLPDGADRQHRAVQRVAAKVQDGLF